MKNSLFWGLLFTAGFTGTYSCEKGEYEPTLREQIVGTWLLETRQDTTVVNDSVVKDTSYVVGNRKYIIDASDTLTIENTDELSAFRFLMKYHAPDSLFISSCPLNLICFYSWTDECKIVEFSENQSMTLRYKHKFPANKIVITRLYFTRL